jgi:hypothetical protein
MPVQNRLLLEIPYVPPLPPNSPSSHLFSYHYSVHPTLSCSALSQAPPQHGLARPRPSSLDQVKADVQCKSVKSTIDAQLASGQLARDQSYADAWLSGLEGAFGIKSTGRGTEGAGSAAAGGGGAAAGGAVDTGAGAGVADAAAGEGDGAGAGAVDAGAGKEAGNGDGNAGAEVGTGCPAPAQDGVGGNATANTGADATDIGAAADTAAGSGAADAGDGGAGSNIQTFTGSLNGIAATPVLQSDGARRKFPCLLIITTYSFTHQSSHVFGS